MQVAHTHVVKTALHAHAFWRLQKADVPYVLQAMPGQQNNRMEETGPAHTAPASLNKGPGIATATAAHKHAPSDAYELEDLDEEWVAMLNVLDSRLLEVKFQA